jgi:uncharacterized protein YxjI
VHREIVTHELEMALVVPFWSHQKSLSWTPRLNQGNGSTSIISIKRSVSPTYSPIATKEGVKTAAKTAAKIVVIFSCGARLVHSWESAWFRFIKKKQFSRRTTTIRTQQANSTMGCTDSTPLASAFDQPHVMHVPAFYKMDHHCKHELIVKEKLFSWSGDSFKITTLDGRPFGNGIQMLGKVWALRDQMTLLDGNGRPIAVCLRQFAFWQKIFIIYTLHPVYPGQSPSRHDYEGHALYAYAEVRRVPFSIVQEVTFATDRIPKYRGQQYSPPAPVTMTITRTSFIPKKRTVFYRQRPAALMEGGNWNGHFNSYKVTVGPGIDPCLIICLTAICDEMDEDK